MTAPPPLLVAIDAGTGSCRAVVFDPDGNQVALAGREWEHAELPEAPGSQEFDCRRNWALICECTREAVARAPGEVVAVSATSMREGMVLYDEGGTEIWACPNVDSRAGAEASELIESGEAADIYALAGDWVAITAPARLLWLGRNRPELLEATAHVGMLGDWVLTRLCGEFATDPSLGSSSGMFDLATRDFAKRIADICGIDPAVLPPVREPGSAIGELSAAAAAETGLPAGIPVVAGGADTQLALLGIGVTKPGQVTIVGGTFWQHTAIVDRPLIDPEGRLRTLCHAVPGQWMIEGIGFWSGLVMRWFRDGFCELEIAEAAAEGGDPYALLERKAAAVPPGSNGVVGLFSNVMRARRWVHASPAFLQFDITHPERSGRIACFRAIEENAAYVSRAHLRIISEVTGLEPEEVVFTGGGAKGTLWPQILADVLGLPVRLPAVKESTALGAALLAGVGAGIYDDAAEAATRVAKLERTVEPDPGARLAYDALFDQWEAVYARSLSLSEDGLLRGMWRAAGT